MLKLLLLGVLTCCSFWSRAQNPTLQWNRAFGGSSTDFPYTVQATADGGFIVGGYSDSGRTGEKTQPSQGSNDYWVVKLDAAGVKQWDKTYGGTSYDILRSLQQTADGGYVLGGYTYSQASGDVSESSRGGADYWVIKLDATGAKQWDHRFGGDQFDLLYALQQTADGGYILGGSSVSAASGDKSTGPLGTSGNDGWVVKLDASGHKQWDRTLGGAGFDELGSLAQTTDGGYVAGFSSGSPVSGNKTQPANGRSDYWVVKLNATGQVEWDRTLGGDGLDYFVAALQTRDGGYLVGGHTDSGVSGSKTQPTRGGVDYWVVKLDAAGRPQWDQRVGTALGDTLGGLRQTRDGGYLLGGNTRAGISGDKTQPGRGSWDYWVVKLDATGQPQWDATYGGNAREEVTGVLEAADGTCVVAGTSYSSATGDRSQPTRGGADYWVVKLSPPPLVAISGATALCSGGELGLTATATPGLATYAWSTGATTSTVRVQQPGTYRVTATFADGQTRTAAHQVSAFVATLRIGGDSVLCAGQPLELAAVTTGAIAYAWSTGATTPTIRVTQTGPIALAVTYAGGCTALARVVVRPPDALTGLSLGNDTTLCTGTPLVLRAPVLGGVHYRWSDGSTGPTLTVQQTGVYSLTLTGCETRVLTRRVAVQSCVAIPNVITPNGDGQNDRFRVTGLAGTGWHLTVYNRWGQAVYQSANYLGEWGEHAAPGLYYYVLQHTGANALYRGWVEAIR